MGSGRIQHQKLLFIAPEFAQQWWLHPERTDKTSWPHKMPSNNYQGMQVKSTLLIWSDFFLVQRNCHDGKTEQETKWTLQKAAAETLKLRKRISKRLNVLCCKAIPFTLHCTPRLGLRVCGPLKEVASIILYNIIAYSRPTTLIIFFVLCAWLYLWV